MKPSNHAKNFSSDFPILSEHSGAKSLDSAFKTLDGVATELKQARNKIATKARRRTRLVSRLLRQVDHTLTRLADLQVDVEALQVACEVLAEIEEGPCVR